MKHRFQRYIYRLTVKLLWPLPCNDGFYRYYSDIRDASREADSLTLRPFQGLYGDAGFTRQCSAADNFTPIIQCTYDVRHSIFYTSLFRFEA